MDREYYSLEKAADILNKASTEKYTSDNLIYQGRIGTIKIYVLTAGFSIKTTEHLTNLKHRENYPGTEARISPRPVYMPLMPECLFRMESQGDTEVILEREPIYSYQYDDFDSYVSIEYDDKPGKFRKNIGYWHYALQRENMPYPDFEMLKDWQQRGGNIDDISPKPILLSECKMVVLADDLKSLVDQLQQSTKSKNQNKPNGHEERHAKDREAALGAAIAAMILWPNECKPKTKQEFAPSRIAQVVIKNSSNFFEGLDVRPLSKERISELINDWTKRGKAIKIGK
jgi:hypothetical protein